MLEDLIEKKKHDADKKAEIQKNKIDFVKNIFYKNYNLIKEYIKKENLSPEQAFENLWHIIDNLKTPLYLEANQGKTLSIKDINETLYVKLGYFELQDIKAINPKEPFEQCSLDGTKKGQEIYTQYRQLENN
jgi:hypothetical protein